MLFFLFQVVGIFAGFGVLLLVASPFLLLAAPCILCCKCKMCKCCEDEEGDGLATWQGMPSLGRSHFGELSSQIIIEAEYIYVWKNDIEICSFCTCMGVQSEIWIISRWVRLGNENETWQYWDVTKQGEVSVLVCSVTFPNGWSQWQLMVQQ